MLLEQNLLPFLIPSPVSNLCVTGLQSMLECLSERWRTEEIIKTNSRQPGVREPDAVGAGPWGWTSLCWQALSGHRRTVPSPLSLIPSLRWRESIYNDCCYTLRTYFGKWEKNVIRVKTFILNLLFRKSSWEAELQRRSIFYFKKDFDIWNWN